MKTTHSRRVRLSDIAEATGYTINTVSRALKGMPDISRETTAVIRDKARQMGYVQNHMAACLRSGHTRTIAVIVADLMNLFFGIMLDGIEAAANELGYTIIVFSTYETQERELKAIETAISRQVDGIILFPCQQTDESITMIKNNGVPFVLVSRRFEDIPTNSVICDEERGGYLATKHLIQHGHRKLIYLCNYEIAYSMRMRMKGFQRAAREAGIPDTDALVVPYREYEPTAKMIAEKYGEGFTGIFVYCDSEAWRVIAHVEKQGLDPKQLGFIGFDNVGKYFPIPFGLCTVDGHYDEISRNALRLLSRQIDKEVSEPETIQYPVELICRGSCAKHDSHK